jgi:hypothetical protein
VPAREAVAPPGFRPAIATQHSELLVSAVFLIIAVGFNLYQLYPEVALTVPMPNDGIMHLLALERAVAALLSRQDPTDAWLPQIAMGYPLFHYYQHLPYVLPAAAYLGLSLIVGAKLSIFEFYNWTNYLLLSLFPVSIYWSMRRFGFGRLESTLASLSAPLISTNGLFGFDLNSYVWRGYGLYTQLWGMVLLPPALAQAYAVLRTGRGYFWAAVLLTATTLSHLAFGYTALASLLLFALLAAPLGGVVRTLRRLALLSVPLGLATSYFLVPLVLDSAYLNRSVWDANEKYDSYGHAWVLGRLVRGELFDHGRFPSLTLLVGLGAAICVWRWRRPQYRLPLALSILWLLLYFGRPTWGVLLDLTPLSRDLYLHRLIAGVHLGGIYLVGLALAVPWSWALSRPSGRYLLVPAMVTALLLLPAYRERAAYLAHNAYLIRAAHDVHTAEHDLKALIDWLKDAPPGRVYAGLAGTWGSKYRIGDIPVYALLTRAGLDTLSFLYHPWSLNGDIQVLFDERRPEQYNLFNVRYVVAPAERDFPDFVKPARDFGQHRLYEVATSGYFELAGSDLSLVGGKADFYPAASRWLASDQPRVHQHPILHLREARVDYRRTFPLSQAEAVIPRGFLAMEPPRGSLRLERIESNAYLAEVLAERESVLMLKTTYHPNWQAYVDGASVPTFMVMPSYVGVNLAPGVHDVRFEYRPQPLRSYLMVLGALALLLTAAIELRREGLRPTIARLRLKPSQVPRRALATLSWRAVLAARARVSDRSLFLGAVVLMALLSGLPLLQFRLTGGHDALEYLPRNVEFYRALTGGQIPPRWAPDMSGGHGEPFFSFNPPLIYALTALFHSLGFGFIASENLACMAVLAAAGIGMYLLAADFFGSRGGLVSATAYLFAPYLHSRLYVSHALADFSAFGCIPFALWGLYRFADARQYRFLLVGSVSVALLQLSSNPVALIAFPALAFWVTLLGWTGRSTGTLLRGMSCLGIGLGLSAFFWLPAVLEREFVHTHRLLESFLNYRNHFASLRQLIDSPWGYGVSLPGPGDGMSFAIGPVHLAAVVGSTLLLPRIRHAPARARLMLRFSLVIVLFGAFLSIYESGWVWGRLVLLQYLEYPWRFLTLVAVGTAVLCGLPFAVLPQRRERLANALMLGLIAGVLLLNLPHARPDELINVNEGDYSPYHIAARYLAVTTAWEYEPIWVSERPRAPAAEPVTLLAGSGRLSAVTKSATESQFWAEITEESRLRINTFYFPGWSLYVDNQRREIDRTNPQGVMEFALEPGLHEVRVVFEDTAPRVWGRNLSVLAMLLLAGVMFARAYHVRLEYRPQLPRAARLIGSGLVNGLARHRRAALTRQAELPFLAGVVSMALLSGLPLFQLGLMAGHDTFGYLVRNVEFYQALTGGQVLPRWAPDLSGGHGEPFFNFNPPLIYYLSAFFHALGFSFIASENLACLVLLQVAGLGMYRLASEFLGCRGGLVAASAYLFAPYLHSRLYVSHALADFSASAWLPLVVWGLYRFAESGRYPFLLVGAASLALLLLSSNPVALITFPTLGLLLGWLAWSRQSLRVLLRGVWCLALGLGLSALFWLPALVERDLVHTQRLSESFLNYRNHFAYLHQLVHSPWGYGFSVPGPDDGMSFAIGPIHLALAALSLLVFPRIRRARPRAGLMVAFCLTLLVLSSFFSVYESEFVWDHLLLLQYLQFPWRFLALASVSTAFLCGAPLLLVSQRDRLADAVMAVLIAVVLVFNLEHARPENFMDDVNEADYHPEQIVAGYLTATTVREYEPIWVRERPPPAEERVSMLAGQGRVMPVRQSATEYELRAEIADEARLRINTFYFPGWTLYVNGAERPIDATNLQGLMEFQLERGVHRVQLVFGDTPVRLWATRLSLLALLLLVLSPWLSKWAEIYGLTMAAPAAAARASGQEPRTVPGREAAKLLVSRKEALEAALTGQGDRRFCLQLLLALLIVASLWPAIAGWRLIQAYSAIPTVPATVEREVVFSKPNAPPMSYGQGVVVNETGAIFVADRGGRRLLGFLDGTSASGVVLAPRPGEAELEAPHGLALGPDGRLYLLDAPTGVVGVYDQAGTLLYTSKLASPGAQAIAVDRQAAIYVGDTNPGVIRKFLPTGVPDLGWGDPFSGGSVAAERVVGLVSVDEQLYAATAKGILRLDVGGRVLSSQPLVGNPGMLAAAPDGTLFMSDIARDEPGSEWRTHRVWRLDRDGVILGRIVGTNRNEAIFEQPQGAAVTSSGHIYIVNDNRITVYKLVER